MAYATDTQASGACGGVRTHLIYMHTRTHARTHTNTDISFIPFCINACISIVCMNMYILYVFIFAGLCTQLLSRCTIYVCMYIYIYTGS
jgi:hypothetical protein